MTEFKEPSTIAEAEDALKEMFGPEYFHTPEPARLGDGSRPGLTRISAVVPHQGAYWMFHVHPGNGDARDWFGLQSLRALADAVIVGGETIRSEDITYNVLSHHEVLSALRERHGLSAPSPYNVVLSGKGVPADASVFSEGVRTVLFTSLEGADEAPSHALSTALDSPDDAVLEAYRRGDSNVLVLSQEGRVNLERMLVFLHDRLGVHHASIEAGSGLASQLMPYTDRFLLTVRADLDSSTERLTGEVGDLSALTRSYESSFGVEFVNYRR